MDDLFDQVKKEMEAGGADEESAAPADSAAAESSAEPSAQDLIDDISWDDVAGELEEQRDMIKDEAAAKSGVGADMVPDGPGDDGLLSSLSGEQRQQLPSNIGFILDIPLQLSVEIGRTRMIINDLLQLGQGSVVELDKLAGEPFDVLVNSKLIARGEVVVVNEKFGIRLTDIISPTERIEQLK
jgi:flagellar motor switch protein FliN/FliY